MLALIALAGSVSSADATVTASQITSPSGPTYTLDNATEAPSTFAIKGTTVGTGNVDINCYSPTEYKKIASGVTVTGNTFSTTGSSADLNDRPCVLRAVPEGDTTAYPPAEPSTFEGPKLARSYFEPFENSTSKDTFGYEYAQTTLSAYNEFESAGECGLDYSELYAPGSLEASDGFFYCDGALFSENNADTRSEIQIDGQNAYDSSAANRLYEDLHIAHAPAPISITQSFDSSTGEVTLHEVDPILECASTKINPNTYPATSESCESLVSAGVQLERTWQTSHAGQVIDMTDTWRSTDGASHSLNALYFQEFVNSEPDGGSFEFPGQSGFVEVKKGAAVSLPGGSGTILYKEDQTTPASGNSENLQGAIVYDSAPSEALAFTEGTNEKSGYDVFEMPYQRTIPAGGAYALRMSFVQASALSEVESLAAAAIASYPPTVSIASPTNGSTVTSPSVTVSGTASDTGALASLTVNGQAVSVGAGGAWSTSVTLSKGANTITAIATDQAGLSSSSSVSVTYSPPPVSPPPAAPVAHASQVGYASGSGGEVSFTIACTGTAGTSCEVEATVSTVEKTHNGKPVAVSAKAHGKTKTKHVTVGSVKLTIPAGQRVKIATKLNALGRSLLARFGKLPVHLDVVLVSAGKRSTIIAQNLTVTPPHKPKHHKKHRP